MAKINRVPVAPGLVLLHTRHQWSGYSPACADDCLALVRDGHKVLWRLRLRLLPSERRWAWHTMEYHVPGWPQERGSRERATVVEAAAQAISGW